MRKYILVLSIVSSALISGANYSAANEVAAKAYNEQTTRGIINDLICFYKKGIFDRECWFS